ncbi:PCI-domain-containing protein [Cantharellus anzutake]|uniref:PCI-domain-containing protein n=1 Tax=Cantharellus anzutake TaxID=1750568 RepID=UPI001908DB3E|nr:PCI-domain-containing protein [Cantharellus anzutake]KAF8338166.1 PCI-domain-containing protein [Cantharellus anzutake]
MSLVSSGGTATYLSEADSLIKTDARKAESLYQKVLQTPKGSDDALKDQESALIKLGQLYRDEKNASALAELVKTSRGFMSAAAKAKTAKLIRTLINYFSEIPGSEKVQIEVTQDNIEWARSEKRIFLKQSLEARLIALHLDTENYRPALALIDSLLKELKRLDDKETLTEVHLLESRVYRGLNNLAKAKTSLTSARTAANAIYCPPPLQAQLDLQSGILHAEDKDYKTAYSYFFETFENLSAQDDPNALNALKYMLLCKIMLNLPEDVNSLLSIKLAIRYAQLREIESMRAIARAHQRRNLADFEKALKDYREELSSDPTIRSHLAALYDTLLEQNLLRIVEPYSNVEIAYVAEMVGQGVPQVEAKLSQMILDKVLNGVLDQGNGTLVVFDEPVADEAYPMAIQTIGQIGKVVEALYAKTIKIA